MAFLDTATLNKINKELEEQETDLIFVYGILKDRLEGEKICDDRVINFGILPGSKGFPKAVVSPTHYSFVRGQVWRIPTRLLEQLDIIEGTAHEFYHRIRVLTLHNNHWCWMYLYNIKLEEEYSIKLQHEWPFDNTPHQENV